MLPIRQTAAETVTTLRSEVAARPERSISKRKFSGSAEESPLPGTSRRSSPKSDMSLPAS